MNLSQPLKHLSPFIWGLVLILAACSTGALRVNNYSYLYSKDLLLHPDFRVYNVSEDSTWLYFRLNTTNLLYTRSTREGEFSARMKVEIEAYNNYSDKFAFYSDSSEYIDSDNNQIPKDLIGRFALPLPVGRNYLVRVSITDQNRNTNDTKFIRVFKEPDLIRRQGFLALNKTNMVPVISKILTNEDELLLAYNLGNTREINATFYEPSTRLARAPFDMEVPPRESFKPKLNYTLADSSGYFPIRLEKEPGIYFFQGDSNNIAGTAFFRFSEDHPRVNSGEQLLGPIQFVATNEEFKEMSAAANKKIAAENFWIRRCGSKERAREVIKAFYKRVEEANEFFTSYKEGWKTDRGMIYIIFGPPDGLYMRDGGENWVYGQETNVNSINMLFLKNDNPFTENDLQLQRNPTYRPNWYMAIDYWRTGRIFSL